MNGAARLSRRSAAEPRDVADQVAVRGERQEIHAGPGEVAPHVAPVRARAANRARKARSCVSTKSCSPVSASSRQADRRRGAPSPAGRRSAPPGARAGGRQCTGASPTRHADEVGDQKEKWTAAGPAHRAARSPEVGARVRFMRAASAAPRSGSEPEPPPWAGMIPSSRPEKTMAPTRFRAG